MAKNLISDDDVQLALDRLRFKASDAAKARAERIYMEAYCKTVKANVMKNHVSLPLSAQEREAYSSSEYQTQLGVMRDAIEKDEMHRWQMIAAQAVIEAWRTASANQRGEKAIG